MSSEDEENKSRRLDSMTSYTSEDEANNGNHSTSLMTQQSTDSVISYYNPAASTESEDDDQQNTSFVSKKSVKRSYSYTSDEPEEIVSKRQKFARYLRTFCNLLHMHKLVNYFLVNLLTRHIRLIQNRPEVIMSRQELKRAKETSNQPTKTCTPAHR